MRLCEDRVFPYRGYHGCRSKCRLRVFAPEPGENQPYVVIATEVDDNPGTSITNAAEKLAWEVWCYLEKPGRGMRWIEHYPDRMFIGNRPMLREGFDIVEFDCDPGGRFARPRWRRVPKCEVEALVGVTV